MYLYIREFVNPDDYELVKSWWIGHNSNIIPLEILPSLGIICYDKRGKDIGCCWLYMDNSVGLCWLAWPVINPDASLTALMPCLNVMTEWMCSRAKELGYGFIMVGSGNETLQKIHIRNGFFLLEQNFSSLGKVI